MIDRVMNLHIIDFAILDHVLFFILAIVLPLMSVASSRQIDVVKFNRESKIRLYYGNSLFLWIMASLVLTTWNYMDRSFLDLGFQIPILDNLVYLLTVIFIFLYLMDLVIQFVIEKRQSRKVGEWNSNTQFLPKNLREYSHYTFLAFSAGICEEILFRGFLIHYLISIFGHDMASFVLALVLPALLFSMGHLYQGKWAMIKIFLGAVLLGLLYFASSSLILVIAIHIIVDLVSALFAFLVYKDKKPQVEDISTVLENEKE